MYFRQLRAAVYENFAQVLLVLIMLLVFSKLGVTYLSPSGKLTVPETQFSANTLGRDLSAYTTLPVYEIRGGGTPFIFGYGSVFVATAAISILEQIRVCNPNDPVVCTQIVYQLFVVSSIVGLFLFVYLSVHPVHRGIAILLYLAFILGVPMNKAIEAGNLDAILASLYGAILYGTFRLTQGKHPSRMLMAFIGILMGVVLSTKAFFLPGILLAIWITRTYRPVIVWFTASYLLTSLWPWLYGVRAGVFDVFAFAMRGSDAFGSQLFTQVNYGNNAIISYVSNVLQAVDTGMLSLPTHTTLTYALSACVLFLIYILPLIQERVDIRHLYKQLVARNANVSVPFAILLYTYATVSMLTLTAWSYDYRIVYLVPLLAILLSLAESKRTKELLYWSIILLSIKCMWIPKDRIMNIFLYAHLYLLIRTAVSLYIDSTRLMIQRGRKTR